MHLNKEESEMIGWLLEKHWNEFFETASEVMSERAVFMLAEKFHSEQTSQSVTGVKCIVSLAR